MVLLSNFALHINQDRLLDTLNDFSQGDYMKAEKLFKEVMSRHLRDGGDGAREDDNQMVAMSLKLARLYATWKDDEKAAVGFRFCVDAQERKVKAGEYVPTTKCRFGGEKMEADKSPFTTPPTPFLPQATPTRTPWRCWE